MVHLFPPVVVDEQKVKCVNVPRDVSKEGEADVDEKIWVSG